VEGEAQALRQTLRPIALDGVDPRALGLAGRDQAGTGLLAID